MGATLLCLVVAPMEVEEVMHSVEWDMLLFFAAQFVMVEVGGGWGGRAGVVGLGWAELPMCQLLQTNQPTHRPTNQLNRLPPRWA
jgi:hypothetical protein